MVEFYRMNEIYYGSCNEWSIGHRGERIYEQYQGSCVHDGVDVKLWELNERKTGNIWESSTNVGNVMAVPPESLVGAAPSCGDPVVNALDRVISSPE